MIEVFNAKRTHHFGCFASFKSAEDTLNRLAREVWESDDDAICFDIDDLVQIESALQEICNLVAGIDCDDEE